MVAYLKKEFGKAETHFEETAASCAFGIVSMGTSFIALSMTSRISRKSVSELGRNRSEPDTIPPGHNVLNY